MPAPAALRHRKILAETRSDLRVAISSQQRTVVGTPINAVVNCRRWYSLSKCSDQQLIEISFADKARHFKSLNRKTGISYDNMVFFDNRSVGKLYVKCYHTPNGMTRNDWNQCREDFGIN